MHLMRPGEVLDICPKSLAISGTSGAEAASLEGQHDNELMLARDDMNPLEWSDGVSHDTAAYIEVSTYHLRFQSLTLPNSWAYMAAGRKFGDYLLKPPCLMLLNLGCQALDSHAMVFFGFRTADGAFVNAGDTEKDFYGTIGRFTGQVNTVFSVIEDTAVLSGGSPTGSYTLTFAAQTTSAIPYGSSIATIQAALEALSTIGTGNVRVYGGDAGGAYLVEIFPPSISMRDTTSLSAAAINEVQTITVTGGAGTFTITYGGQTIGAQAFGVSAADLQTALRALTSINGANVTVTGSDGGPFTVTFIGTLANTNVAQMTGVGSGGATVVIATTQDGEGPTVSRTRYAIQHIDAGGSNGTIYLQYRGKATSVSAGTTRAGMKSALTALSTIGANGVTVLGTPTDDNYTVIFNISNPEPLIVSGDVAPVTLHYSQPGGFADGGVGDQAAMIGAMIHPGDLSGTIRSFLKTRYIQHTSEQTIGTTTVDPVLEQTYASDFGQPDYTLVSSNAAAKSFGIPGGPGRQSGSSDYLASRLGIYLGPDGVHLLIGGVGGAGRKYKAVPIDHPEAIDDLSRSSFESVVALFTDAAFNSGDSKTPWIERWKLVQLEKPLAIPASGIVVI